MDFSVEAVDDLILPRISEVNKDALQWRFSICPTVLLVSRMQSLTGFLKVESNAFTHSTDNVRSTD